MRNVVKLLFALGVVFLGFCGNSLNAQVNYALTATAAHSSGGASPDYGAELYNNGIIPTPYTATGVGLWGWLNSNGWIEFTWSSPVTFNRVKFYKAGRPMYTCTFEYWNSTTSSYVSFHNYNSTVIEDSVDFTPITTTKFRMNTIAGSGNPNFMEIQVILTKQGINNAGISSLIAPKAFCAGNKSVEVQIGNFGRNKIDSVRVNWTVDGTPQNTYYHSSVMDTLGGSGSTTANITLGTINFPDGITKTIKIWTSYPNGQVDPINTNDTQTYVLKPSLSGVFTVGGAGADYASPAAAATDVTNYGVCGPVVLKIAPGTYTGRVLLGDIAGVSSTNTITFVGSGIGSTILTASGNTTTDWSTIYLNGSDYVGFRDMTIRGTGATNSLGVHLTNKADYNRFDNLRFEMNATATGASVWAIAGSGSATSVTGAGDACNYTWIDSITVTGGYGGVSIYGTGTTTAHSFGNKVTNSTFTSLNTYGIRFYYQNNLELDNNTAQNFRSTTAYGLYVYYSSDFLITNNEIASPYMALYLYYGNVYLASGSFESEVYNNILKGGSYFGMYSYNSVDVNLYHNTIMSSYGGTSTTTYYAAAYFYTNDNLDCRNNIFVNDNSSDPLAYAVVFRLGAPSAIDYNTYKAANPILVHHDADYADIAAWRQAFPLFNKNSLELEPVFAGTNDLHLDHSVNFPRGVNLGITNDVDGDVRCTIVPTIGADESEYVSPSATAGVARADTIYVSSPTTFFSTYQPVAGVIWAYTWYIDDIQAGIEQDFVKTFATTGTYEVKLRAMSCSGSDWDSIMVNVVNPTSTPVTDFTASKLIVDVSEKSLLSDLSDFGATSWSWTAIPAADAVFSNASASNPTVHFNKPGTYDICLMTANGLGQSTTLCKTAYISVNEDAQICDETESNLATGRLTDEGGVNGNYSANSNCNFYIHPCASEVTLRFTQWNLSDADDVLRVYDGSNSTGTLLGTFNSTSSIPGGAAGLVAGSGKMYLEWRTSPAGQSGGFTAYWTSKPDLNAPVPVANFATVDTVFTNQTVTFTSTSTGTTLRYTWDFNPPFGQAGLEGGNKEFDRYSWTTAGTYLVSLSVSNCGGTDGIIKNIQVVAPTTKPVVAFAADRTKVPVLTTVTLKDGSFQGGTSWKWTITPSATANLLTPDNGKDLKVAFIKSGKYTVKLKVSNSLGTDSLEKVEYLEVFDYCAPVVGSTSADVAISRVQFKGIDNLSPVGVNKYTSYLNDFTPEVVSQRESILIRVERQSNTDPLNRKVWVDWNNDGDFDDSGEEVAYEASSYTQNFTASFMVPNTALIGYTTLRVGVSYDNDPNKPCGINPTGEFEDYPIQIIIDKQAPAISLIGQDSVWVEKGYQYLDAGAIALDNVDGNLTGMMIISNPVDSTVVGTYVVRYNVTDADGNVAAEVTRIVIVTPDITAPVITLNGTASIDITVGTTYTDAGATASDYFQHDMTPQIQSGDNIDMGTLGTYYFWYTVEDASGNKDSIAREVNVIDDIAPVLTLLGDNPLVVEVKTTLNEPGYTVTDNFDANPIMTVDASEVDVNELGLYTVTYMATDASGNTSAIATRMIRVEDNTPPLIWLIGADTILVDVFDSYNEQGIHVQDNYCTGLAWNVDQQPNTNVLGDYLLTYSSTDCNGNLSLTTSRVIRVLDREAPKLTLNGFAANTMYRWQTYTDPGVSIDDNYYSEAVLQDSVKVTGNLDPNWVGFYSICYTVTDPSGNKSKTICREMEVLESITSASNPAENRVSLFPNPAKTGVTIKLDAWKQEFVEVEIYSMLGQRVHVDSIQNGIESLIDVSTLSEGTYLVKIVSNQHVETIKLLIIK